MKTLLIAMATATLLLSAGLAQAGTPVVDQRQANQDARIDQGVASGELTAREARRLRAEQRHIQRVEHRAKADGVVTAGERAHLQHEQNQADRRIRRNKHDAQDRH